MTASDYYMELSGSDEDNTLVVKFFDHLTTNVYIDPLSVGIFDVGDAPDIGVEEENSLCINVSELPPTTTTIDANINASGFSFVFWFQQIYWY